MLPFDLPFIFQTEPDTIPKNDLRANKQLVERWEPRLQLYSADRLRVGLVWKGNPNFPHDETRSLPALSTLAPLFDIRDAHFFSLQKGEGESEAASASLPNFVHVGGDLTDYAVTAAILESLDLVISSDTSVAHLAGAMGKPVWLMTPGLDTGWQWMIKRTDSLWYLP